MNRLVSFLTLAFLLSPVGQLMGAGNLFINEVLFNPPTDDAPKEYIELRGATNDVIGAGTYFISIDGNGTNTGGILNVIPVSGLQVGSNGFVVLLQKFHTYATVSGATVLTNSGSLGGWGDGSGSSIGHGGDDGETNLFNASITFLLIRSTVAPANSDDADVNDDGVLDGVATNWTVLDAVGILDNTGSPDKAYGLINFRRNPTASATGTIVDIGFTAGYVARNGHTVGWTANDWVAGDNLGGTAPNFTLGNTSNTYPTSRANAALNHIGGSNFGAPFSHTPSLSHSEALSGVVNHPGNPILPLTISDAETALSALQVSATSLDTAALPTNRVTVVFTNNQWIVRIAPTNVCFNASIRVRVSDGTNYSENILPYSASGLWGTNVGFHIGISDASTAIPLDTNYMLVADDETFPLRIYSRNGPGLAIKTFNFTNSLNLTNLDGEELAEMDIEASARFGDRIYWLGSLGNITDGPLAPNRNRIYATDISGSGTNAQLNYVGRYDKLRDDVLKWDTDGTHGKGAGYYGLATSAAVLHPPKTNDGFVVEGFCFIATGGSNQAYLGLRAPLVPRGERRRALLIPMLNLASLVTNNPATGPAQLGAPVELDLGGRGIRSLEYTNGTYWILAGPPGDSTDDPYEFRLFTWSGNALQAPQMWSANFAGIRPEGIVGLRTNGTNAEIQVVGDHGFSKLYQPASSSTAKKLSPAAFKQFRLDWVAIGSPEPLQVMPANFAASGASRFVRGTGTSNELLSIVEALDNIPGVRLDDGGGNANTFYPGHDWTNQWRHWNATNTSQPLVFTNPLAAFGSLAGMPTLYVGRTYHFHIAAGTAIGTNRQALRVAAYNRATKQNMGWQELLLPSPADSYYQTFFERGLVFSLPAYGLDSIVRPQFTAGAPSQEFTVEHRASKAEYFFVVSLSGQVLSNGVAAPLVWGSTAVASPLYVLNFDLEPAWQSHFLAQPHLHGEPAPSAFLGKSTEELRATNLLNMVSLVVTQAQSSLTNVDLSPELRSHPQLERLVSDFDRDPIALANYVFNEVLLTDAFSPGAASSALRSGGVRRGAMAAYMESQGSPLEQCALLVYLLRRCNVPAGFVFPVSGTLKLHQNALERLFPFTIQVSGATNANALVEADFPYVAAYVDGAWRPLVPWLKDLEVQEGLDINDYMPARYSTGRDWVMGYLRFDVDLMRLAFKSDTPMTLLPRYLKQMLQDNYTGLTLEDFGVRVRTRKHHYSRWSDFPLPAVVTGTNTVIESLATLIQSQTAYSNLFESVEVEVTSTTNASRMLTTGKFRLLDLHTRVLQLWFVETNGNHEMKLGLNAFRSELTNSVSFSNAVSAGLTSTQALNELRDSVLLDATDDELTLRLRWHSYQPPTNSNNPILPAVTLVQPNRITNTTVIERKLRKGDLSTVYFNAGRVSTRMMESLFEESKRARAATNASGAYLRPERVDGLTACLIGGTWFHRTDAFRGALGRLYKTHVDASRSVAVSSLLAKRQTNGVLLSGAIQLSRPRLDVCFRETSLVGNGTLRPDINPANERAVQDFLDLNALNEGAQEHQVLNDLFGRTNAISTVSLLQASQLQGLLSQPGILRLTATNYIAYGETEYPQGAGQKKLKDFDPALWQTVQSVFGTPGISNAALVLMTPGEIDSAVGKRVGALILSPRYHAALLNTGLNGGEGASPAQIGQAIVGQIRLFANTGEWLSLEQFGHDLDGGNVRVDVNRRTDGTVFFDVQIMVDGIVAFHSEGFFSPPVPPQEQVSRVIDYDPESRLLLLNDLNLDPSTTSNEQLANTIEDVGILNRTSFGERFGNFVSDPVSVLSGEFYINDTDLSLPGPLPLTIGRNYSSRSFGEGDFGQNWKISLTPYLVRIPNENAIDAAEPDGTVLRYTKVGSDVWRTLWQENRHYDNSSAPAGPARNLNNRFIIRTNSATVTNYVVLPGDGSARVYTWRGFPRNGRSYLRPWLSSWQDPLGNALRFEYGEDPLAHDYAKVRRISSSSGSSVVLNYNERGLISELFSKDGQRLSYNYNRWGDLTEVTRPDGSRVNYTYLFEPSRDPAAVSTNSLEAWVAFTNAVTGKIDYQRGVVGTLVWTNLVSTHRLLRVEQPEGRELINDYDPKGRVVKQYATVGLDQRPVQNAEFIYTNNDSGSLVSPPGLITGSTKVIDGLGRTNFYHYTDSKVYLIQDAEGNTNWTGWHYDWVTYETGMAWNDYLGRWYTTHSAESYPRSKSLTLDARGLTTRFKYNPSGNTTNVTVQGDLLGDGNTNTTATVSIQYNGANLPERIIQSNGATNLYYYTNTWLLSRVEVWPSNATAADAITNLYFYTSVSNTSNGFVSHGLRSMEVRAANSPDVATNRYEYDERGYLTRIIRQTGTADPDVILTNRFSARGWLEEQMDAAGRRTRFAYDGMGRPQQQEVFEPGGTKPIAWRYTHYNENGDAVWADGPRFGPEDYTFRDYDGGGRPTQMINWRSRARSDGMGVEAETGANQFTMAFSEYDVFGNKTRCIDPRGNVTSNRYDRIGRRTQTEWYSSTGEFLGRESFGYEPGHQISAYTNALGGFSLIKYNARGQPVNRRNVDGSTNRWLYYADGRLHRQFACNGSYEQLTYDDKNRRVTSVFYNTGGIALATNVVEFDRRGNLVRFEDAAKFAWTNQFDDLDRVKVAAGPAITSVTPPNTPLLPGISPSNTVQQISRSFYDAAGVAFTNINALGDKFIIWRDALGRAARIEIRNTNNVLFRELTAAYAEDHHSVTLTNGSGTSAIVSTTFTDTDGQPVLSIAYPASGVREFVQSSYDVAGNLVSRAHKSGTNGTVVTWTTSSYAYDGLNRLSSQTDRDGAVTLYGYDANGNLTNQVLPGGQQWRAGYDSANRLLNDFILGSGGTGSRSNAYTYFSSGRWLGLPQSSTEGRGVSCAYGYDDWLRLATNTHTGSLPEHNLSTLLRYDVRGYLTDLIETYTNAATGPPITNHWAYDAYGLPVRESIQAGSLSVSSSGQSWDSAGRRAGVDFHGFGYAFTWDADGLLASATGQTGGGSYGYDTAGMLLSRTVGRRTTSVTSRDGTGRTLTRSTIVDGTSRLAETMTWTGDGLLATHQQVRNDTNQFTDDRAYAYAPSTRWLTQERLNLDANKQWTNTFTYDRGVVSGPGVLTQVGQAASLSPTWRGGGDAFSRIANDTNTTLRQPAYGYVNAYRNGVSVRVTVDGQPQQVALVNTGLSNNPIQWRATMDLSTGAHQIVAIADHTFGLWTTNTSRWFTNTAGEMRRSTTFDGAGQVTGRVWLNPNGSTNRTQNFTWDARGRLLRIEERDTTGGGMNWGAVYDGLDRRLQTIETPVTNGGTVLPAQARVITSYFDPQVEFLELGLSVDGRTTWKLYGPDAPGDYGDLNGRGGFDAIVPGPHLFCPVLSDARGDVHAVYDQDHGQLHWNSARSGAYGAAPGYRPPPLGHGADIVQASAHAGIWRDSTGYYWRGARYYDPEAGQWLSFDPFGFAAGPNPYGYWPDPVNFTDPNGRLATRFGNWVGEVYGNGMATFDGLMNPRTQGQTALEYGFGLTRGTASFAANQLESPLLTFASGVPGMVGGFGNGPSAAGFGGGPRRWVPEERRDFNDEVFGPVRRATRDAFEDYARGNGIDSQAPAASFGDGNAQGALTIGTALISPTSALRRGGQTALRTGVRSAEEILPAANNAPRVFYVTPQGVAVSSQTLARQGSSHLAGNFQGLAGASVDDVIARVPRGWAWGPQRSGQGIVFRDTAGFERVRMHGPSMNAPAGSNSRMGWTLRVMDRGGNYYDDAGRLVPYRANEGHIPLLGNPNAP